MLTLDYIREVYPKCVYPIAIFGTSQPRHHVSVSAFIAGELISSTLSHLIDTFICELYILDSLKVKPYDGAAEPGIKRAVSVPAAAVAVVLLCAALVFVFGFHSAEQPQFDKLPLVIDDRKSSSKKKKPKEKVSGVDII